MKLACLDTQVLIWAIKEEATSGQEEMVERAKLLIDRLNKSETNLLVPTVVIGEFLIRTPAEAHQTILNLIQGSFMVAQYDIRAALFYAKIWQSKQDKTTLDELQKSGKTRQELKADRMIVATALSSGAECIYSHDKGIKTFGDGFIEVSQIPPAATQTRLPL